SLKDCSAIDFVCRKEFDYSVVEYAQGKPLEDILGISYRKNGSVVHNPDRPQIENLDALPHVTDVYQRDLDVRRYNVPFLLHPYAARGVKCDIRLQQERYVVALHVQVGLIFISYLCLGIGEHNLVSIGV